jgi:hypothetical protein
VAENGVHETSHTFSPGPTLSTVRAADGSVKTAPDGWVLLPPGDAALTRRVKAAGDHWIVQEKKGRKTFSHGVWAPAVAVERIRTELEAERAAFHPTHAVLAERLARAVTEHATPVGSGTVARTKRIPVEQRAEAAVIAWMRHQTTGYDSMPIPRVKGKRREVRRRLARRSHELLDSYRRGTAAPEGCPLQRALPSAPA